MIASRCRWEWRRNWLCCMKRVEVNIRELALFNILNNLCFLKNYFSNTFFLSFIPKIVWRDKSACFFIELKCFLTLLGLRRLFVTSFWPRASIINYVIESYNSLECCYPGTNTILSCMLIKGLLEERLYDWLRWISDDLGGRGGEFFDDELIIWPIPDLLEELLLIEELIARFPIFFCLLF